MKIKNYEWENKENKFFILPSKLSFYAIEHLKWLINILMWKK